MCPSYQATRDEQTTTRARANLLREIITKSEKENPFDHPELYEILDLCLSCKGCKSECPSNVDMAKLKAEFLQHWYDANGVPLRARAIANISRLNKIAMMFPRLSNALLSGRITGKLVKRFLGIAPKRSIPALYKTTLRAWINTFGQNLQPNPENTKGRVYLFIDEFSNFNDTEIGITTYKLLTKLGYRVEAPDHFESGRAYISKGFLRKARKLAEKNVTLLKDLVSEDTPLIGIEPSGILTFRDEYADLTRGALQDEARKLAKNALLIEEFMAREMDAGRITAEAFTTEEGKIRLHGHCQQKAIASTIPTKQMLSLPVNYSVEEIPSGCCGMAGSFGYEAEHYDLSMKVGELVLFPAVRKTPESTILVAPGTSCRHQIKDGTGRQALHPVEVMFGALK